MEIIKSMNDIKGTNWCPECGTDEIPWGREKPISIVRDNKFFECKICKCHYTVRADWHKGNMIFNVIKKADRCKYCNELDIKCKCPEGIAYRGAIRL